MSFKLANGLTVMHFQRPQLPIASAELVVNAGLASTDPALPGVPDFAAAMLDEGTRTRSAQQIAEQFEQLGTAYGAQTRRDTTSLSVDGLSRNFADTMALLADVAQRPTFPADEIERQRKSRMNDIASAREEPGVLAAAAFARAVYGPGNPYGTSSIGTEKSVAQTTGADLRKWWQAQFRPANAALIVVGAIDAARLRALVEQEWGSWRPVGDAPAAATADSPTTTTARAVIVDKPNAPQTSLRVGRLGTERTTPDYPALQVLNFAVGGSYTSRINQNLREDKGYTYGAQSRFDYGRKLGSFFVATAVRSDVTEPAIHEIIGELTRAESAPLAVAELNQARGALTQSLPAKFETNDATASSFSELFAYGLPLDYYRRLPAQYSSVRVATTEALAHRYLDPNSMVFVMVGDRAKLEAALTKLGLGPVEVWPITGTLF